MLSDGELLRRYVDDGSESAFAALVERHLNIVYRAALRRVGGNAHAADDVTQRVFTALARKAGALKTRSSVVGWLYRSTRFAAADVVRGEQRRRRHEQEAQLMNELDLHAAAVARRLEPVLDEIMDVLPDRDREAVLLHFFEGRPFAEVGALLSLSADAARMRVSRALDRLREELERRGVASTGAALASALSGQSLIAAPPTMASAIASRALTAASRRAAASLLARATAALKSTWPACVGGAIVVTVAVTLISRGAAEKDAVADRVSEPAALMRAAPTESRPGISSHSIAPLAKPAAREPDFGQLSQPEKNILAMLWGGQRSAAPGARFLLRLGARAPNAEGVAPLLARHWIGERLDSGQIFLTPEGLAFCAANHIEIEAYVPYANLNVAKVPLK